MSASDEKGSFERYLEAYRKHRGLSVEDAMKHALIRDIKAYYDSIESDSRD